MGEDVDYSTNLMKMLKEIPDEWVILWIEDRLVISPVHTDEIINLVDVAKRERIGFIKLISGHPLPNGHNTLKKIGEIPKDSRYRVCITVGLWRKDLLYRILIPGESPWDIERNGDRLKNMDEKFYSISIDYRKTPPIIDKHIIVKGKVLRDAYDLLNADGVSVFLHERKSQSIKSYLYGKIHGVLKNTYSQLKWFLSRHNIFLK